MKRIPLKKLSESLREGMTAQLNAGNSANLDGLTLREAVALIESQFSHDETRKALYSALRANRYAPDGSYLWRYIRAVYDDAVVYEEETGDTEKLYKAEYSIGTDGAATITNPVEVRVEYVPVTADLSESEPLQVDYTPLKERAIRPDGTMQIKIIGPGKGSSGYYSREVIERDIPKVFPKGTHMMANHQTELEEAERPEGVIQDLAAEFVSAPYYLEESAAPAGEGSYVDVKPFADYAPMLEDKAEAIGVSINAGGDIAPGEVDGQIMPIVERITVGKTVDFVTKAGRDGKIVSLKESLRLKKEAGSHQDSRPAPLQEATIPTGASPTIPQEESPVNETEAQDLRESVNSLKAENARLKAYAPAREAASGAIADLNLPAPVRERIVESIATAPPLSEAGELDAEAVKTRAQEAAKAEAEFAKTAYGWGGGEVEGMGAGETPEGEEAPVVESVRTARMSAGLS